MWRVVKRKNVEGREVFAMAIDTDDWALPLAYYHGFDYLSGCDQVQIHILCFKFRWLLEV